MMKTLTETLATPGGGGARFFFRLARTGGTGSSSKGLVLSTLNREPDTSLRAMRGVKLEINNITLVLSFFDWGAVSRQT